MKQLTKGILVLLLAFGVAPRSHGFSLLGPFQTAANGFVDDWHVPALGYDLPGDIGGPMPSPSEGYRWNMPVITYAIDLSIYNYFGTNGAAAIEEAIALLNGLPPSTQITNDGFNFYIGGQPVPTDNKRVNYDAEALGLLDVKSTTLRLLLEQMGLAEAERWVWGLRARDVVTQGGVTFTNYDTKGYNFDPITLEPTNRVNEAFYNYEIFEPLRPAAQEADAIEGPVDPLQFSFRSLSTLILPGEFYPGLTHDDVGGLRWLLNPENLSVETLQTNVVRSGGARFGSPWIPFIGTNLLGSNVFGTNIVTTNLFGTNIPPVTLALRPGIDKITFRRVNVDFITGQLPTPLTLRYTDRYISSTNGRAASQSVQRVVTEPDILFTAEPLGVDADIDPVLYFRTPTTGWFNNNTLVAGRRLPGGGVIFPPIRISFTDELPMQFNTLPGSGTGPNPPAGGFGILGQFVVWGSFNGTTDDPIVYPEYGQVTLDVLREIVRAGRTP